MINMRFAANKKLNIIIAGYIVGGPLGGLVWHHLQYVLGLHEMGHQVLFVEDSDDYPSCYNPQTDQLSSDPSYGLTFINQVFPNTVCNLIGRTTISPPINGMG